MTDLVVRRLLVDMEQPIERRWCAGDAFRTALLDALSLSFPFGEQFFIDAVRNGWWKGYRLKTSEAGKTEPLQCSDYLEIEMLAEPLKKPRAT